MRKMNKIIGLVLALAVVFSVAACTVSASALSLGNKSAGISISDTAKKILDPSNIINGLKGLLSKGNDKSTNDDAVVADPDEETTTARKPLFDFHIDYDVTRKWNYGFRFGNPPEKTTEPVEEPTVAEEPTEAPTEPEVTTPVEVEVSDVTPEASAPVVDVTESTPLANVEQIANTGDAGVSAIVALSVVSAAAFVVAKKK